MIFSGYIRWKGGVINIPRNNDIYNGNKLIHNNTHNTSCTDVNVRVSDFCVGSLPVGEGGGHFSVDVAVVVHVIRLHEVHQFACVLGYQSLFVACRG